MNKGFVVITSAMLLALLMMIVAISLGSANLFTRFNVVDFNNKQISFLTARSCLDWALLKLADNGSYNGGETITVSAYQCTISPVEASGSNKIIKAHAQIDGATTNLKLTIVATDFSTVSLEELKNF